VTNCFYCGEDDHMGKNCPRLQAKQQEVTRPREAPRPPATPRGAPETWCSYCDEATRLIDMGHTVSRCPQCHPLRYQQLRQNRKCPLCHATVYEWDFAECDRHARPGIPLPRPAVSGRPDWTRLEPHRLCYRSPLGGMVHVAGCACPTSTA
jgi:hypothetical protein